MSVDESKVKKIIARQFGIAVEAVKNESSFVNDLGGDSLDTVELLLEIEDIFDIEIPEDVAENLSTVQEAIDYLNSVVVTN
jgi:acyl carrier protein